MTTSSQTTQPDYFLFRDSAYDFDEVLQKKGFLVKNDMEHQLIFEKNIMPRKEFDPNVINAVDLNFKLLVTRPKMLWSKGKHDLISPYHITFVYVTKPLLMIRRVQWDTFPGYAKEVLDEALDQCEAEAEAILTMLLDVDVQAIKAMASQAQKNAKDPSESTTENQQHTN